MTTISRREMLKFLGAAPLGAALGGTGFSRDALAAEGQFVWAGTGGTWGESIDKYFLQDPGFAAKTGLKISHSAQLESVAASKILASCGNSPYDVSSGSQVDYMMLNGAGCIEEYDPAIVTNLKDVYDEARLGNYYAGWNLSLFGVTWNTKEASRGASFEDLWNPKYKGRVGVPAYGWYGMHWLHAINKLHGGTEDNIGPGIQAVADLVKKNNAVIVENADHGTKVMERGEVVIMPYLNGRTYRMIEAGIPCKFEFVKGMLPIANGFSIVKGTKQREAAQKFINNTLDPEYQLRFARWAKYPPTNRKAVIPPDLEFIKIPAGALEQSSRLDWKKVNDHRAEYLNRWNREVLG
jgi:putative spermidine/putrescine transport system substrate-binding protein